MEVEIVRDYKNMRSGLKNKETKEMIIPCAYHIDEFTMVTDVMELVKGVYVLANNKFNHEIVLGVYFKANNHLHSVPECSVTLFHYTDFNALFTHEFGSHEYKSAILFDNFGNFLREIKASKIVEYNEDKIQEYGILTSEPRVYLIDKEFYLFTKTNYPLAEPTNNTYPFTRLKDRIRGVARNAYGEMEVSADSILEYEYNYEQSLSCMRKLYEKSACLQERFPSIKRK